MLGLINQHYFAVLPVEITSYAVKNYWQLHKLSNYHQIIDKTKKRRIDRYTNSWEVIKYMYENKEEYLTEIPFEDLLDTQYNGLAKEITDLNYQEKACRPNEIPEDRVKFGREKIVFYDFETITNEIIHKPYMVCSSATSVKVGSKCAFYFLRELCERYGKVYNTFVLIAHNAGYDFRCLQTCVLL